uniref:Sodium-and chloride-dependent glycine transporter 2 n=1 Tax=Panagrellus redivivus TaxID=6233 RepID=A0A7E4VKM6_PANRE
MQIPCPSMSTFLQPTGSGHRGAAFEMDLARFTLPAPKQRDFVNRFDPTPPTNSSTMVIPKRSRRSSEGLLNGSSRNNITERYFEADSWSFSFYKPISNNQIGQNITAYFIPLIFSYLLIGAPTFLIELVVGQYSALSVQRIFARVAPLLSAIGGATSMIFIYRCMVYFPLMGQLSLMFIASLRAAFKIDNSLFECPIPGANDSYIDDQGENEHCVPLKLIVQCEHFWQAKELDLLNFTDECYEAYNIMFPEDGNVKSMTTPQSVYWTEYVQRKSYILEETAFAPGPPAVVYSMMVMWLIAAGVSMGGVRSLGWFSVVMSIFPFLCTVIFAIYAAFVDNAWSLFTSFLIFDPKKLLSYEPWVYAVSTTLYSLSLADGGIIHIATHNNFDNNFMVDFAVGITSDVVMTLLSLWTTTISGSWIIGKIYNNKKDTSLLRTPPISDTFAITAFPEMASTQPLGMFIICLYYLNMVLIGLSTMTIGLDMLVKAITDKYHIKNIFYKICTTVMISLVLCGFNLFIVTPGGIFFHRQISTLGVKLLVMVAFLEMIALIYLYGYENFNRNIEAMLGWRSAFAHYLEYALWKGVAPIILAFCLIGQFYDSIFASIPILAYDIPPYMRGWSIVVLISAFLLIPLSIVMKIVQLKRQNRNIRVLLQPSHEWKRIDNYEEEKPTKFSFDTVFGKNT